MARNEEKAQSMLNRWLAYKRNLHGGGPRGPKPTDPNDCETVEECERWRMQMIKDLGKKVMIIQNESLGEQRIRDLNDEINKMLREKAAWEKRILDLGGPNYRKYERIADEHMMDQIHPNISDENDVKGQAYKYFGAARNLPGVKELFMKKEMEMNNRKKQKKEQPVALDAGYYGYQEEEDAVLEEIESKAEKEALDIAEKQWKINYKGHRGESSASQKIDVDISHLAIPSKERMGELLVEKRKKELLRKYVSEEMEAQLEEGKKEVEVVLGKRKSRS